MSYHTAETDGVKAMADWLLKGGKLSALETLLRYSLKVIAWERTLMGESMAFIFSTELAAMRFEEQIPLIKQKLISGYNEQGGIKISEILAGYE